MTPGMKSSEFMLALVPSLIGLVLVVLGLYKGDGDLVTKGVAMLTGASAGYSVSRGLSKLGKSPEPAPVSAEEAAKVLEAVTVTTEVK